MNVNSGIWLSYMTYLNVLYRHNARNNSTLTTSTCIDYYPCNDDVGSVVNLRYKRQPLSPSPAFLSKPPSESRENIQ